MSGRQILFEATPSRDENGRNLPAKLRFFLPGTSIPTTVYADQGLTVPLSFPILSDSAGRFPQIWAEESKYFDVVWSDLANDAFIRSFSDVRPLDDAVLLSATQADAAANAAMASAAEAAATLVLIETQIADLGDFSDAVIAAEAAAVIATAASASAVASAAAAAASAASIDTDQIMTNSRAFAIAAASLL